MLPQNPHRDPPMARILTLGHSNHAMGHLVDLLTMHGVQVIVDVRSQPYSKYATQFNQEALKIGLQNVGLRYVYLGRELGGRPEGHEFYDVDGHVQYDRLAATHLFREGLRRLENGIAGYEVAMLCAEENPAACHRRLLVGRILLGRGVQVEHIRGDGRLQTDEEVEAELNRDLDQLALFQKTEVDSWKSIPSVIRKKRPNNSSAD
jgi:uncharacterized protein (DUF488 family)